MQGQRTILLLLLLTFSHLILADTPTQQAKKSVFESNCTYKKTTEINEDQCDTIQLTKDMNVEILLPVAPIDANYTLLVPFILDPYHNETTLSLEGQKKLRIDNDGQNITILDKELNIKKGEENVLGLNFLETCLLGMDFTTKEAGLNVHSEEGVEYGLNWPLESFKDLHLEKKASDAASKHSILKKSYQEMAKSYSVKVDQLKAVLRQKDKALKVLKSKYKAKKKLEKPKKKRAVHEDL